MSTGESAAMRCVRLGSKGRMVHSICA